MLALRSNTASNRAVPVRSRRSGRSTLRVRAWAGDNSNPFAGLLRFFAPNRSIDTKEDWTGTGSNFTGKISHGPRKPFKDDGYINKLPKSEATQQQEAQEENGDNPMTYLNDAAERVVGHNFTGDDTEPDWSKTGRQGYSGTPKRVKGHKDEGPFHNRVL